MANAKRKRPASTRKGAGSESSTPSTQARPQSLQSNSSSPGAALPPAITNDRRRGRNDPSTRLDQQERLRLLIETIHNNRRGNRGDGQSASSTDGGSQPNSSSHVANSDTDGENVRQTEGGESSSRTALSSTNMTAAENSADSGDDSEHSSNKKRPTEYNKYTDQKIIDFINLCIEGVPVRTAAKKLDITISSAYRYRKFWNETGGPPKRHKKTEGPNDDSVSAKFSEEQTMFIVDFIDELVEKQAEVQAANNRLIADARTAGREIDTNQLAEIPNCSFGDLRDILKEKFPGFTVSTAVLQKHIKAQCSFFLRRIERLDALASRTDMDTMSVVSDWIDSRDIDFFSNTVFVGQATFNKGDGKSTGLFMKKMSGHKGRNKGNSSSNENGDETEMEDMDDEEADKGAGVYQPSTSRGTVITLFGAISPQGLIDVNIQKPQLSDAYDTYHHQQFQNLPHVKQLIREQQEEDAKAEKMLNNNDNNDNTNSVSPTNISNNNYGSSNNNIPTGNSAPTAYMANWINSTPMNQQQHLMGSSSQTNMLHSNSSVNPSHSNPSAFSFQFVNHVFPTNNNNGNNTSNTRAPVSSYPPANNSGMNFTNSNFSSTLPPPNNRNILNINSTNTSNRNDNTSETSVAAEPQGLREEHNRYALIENNQFYLTYLKKLMDLLRAKGRGGCYIVMDESMVICPHFFKTVIVDGGFRCAFYPNMANVADPMERFWARTRTNLDRSENAELTLTARLTAACNKIEVEEYQQWIRDMEPFHPLRLAGDGDDRR